MGVDYRIQKAMKPIPFSPTPPTEPGAYWYKQYQDGPVSIRVFDKHELEMTNGRLWGFYSPRLIPITELEEMRKEVENAFYEGCNLTAVAQEHTQFGELFLKSNARKIAEGKEK